MIVQVKRKSITVHIGTLWQTMADGGKLISKAEYKQM